MVFKFIFKRKLYQNSNIYILFIRLKLFLAEPSQKPGGALGLCRAHFKERSNRFFVDFIICIIKVN